MRNINCALKSDIPDGFYAVISLNVMCTQKF